MLLALIIVILLLPLALATSLLEQLCSPDEIVAMGIHFEDEPS